jgi:hypothetical protein
MDILTRMSRSLFLQMVFLVAVALCLSSAQETPRFKRAAGAGTFPLAFTHASAWFTSESGKQKILTIIVYLEGRPGWQRATTDYKWNINSDPATINMTVGGKRLSIQYNAANGQVKIQDQVFSLTTDNVFLVRGIDEPVSPVVPLGMHNLVFLPEALPPMELLRRNAVVWHKLTGLPIEEHGATRASKAPQIQVDRDRRGLELHAEATPEKAKAACELWRHAATAGYAPAQYRFGYCYESGQGVEENPAIANEWYRKAAEQGHLDAQYKLGHSYRVGRGEKIDLVESRKWYRRAAENGDPDGMNNYAWMSATAEGTTANPQEACEWFLKAARHGDAGAQFEVVRRLREGDGTSNDLTGAMAWLQVLEAQSREFPPEEWKKVEGILNEVTGDKRTQLDEAKKLAQTFMREISANKLALIGRKGI